MDQKWVGNTAGSLGCTWKLWPWASRLRKWRQALSYAPTRTRLWKHSVCRGGHEPGQLHRPGSEILRDFPGPGPACSLENSMLDKAMMSPQGRNPKLGLQNGDPCETAGIGEREGQQNRENGHEREKTKTSYSRCICKLESWAHSRNED